DELYHVVAIDCGIKSNIIRSLNSLGCRVTLVPYDTGAGTIEEMKPDGVFISNGPGDPTDVKATIRTVKTLHGRYPIFGICLGHQILSLSYGASTYKLKFGHRGGNHPVKDLESGKVDITSQNHSYAVDTDSLTGTGLVVTHINLLDNTVEGIAHTSDHSFGIQYHPESAPGPNDSIHLFDRFIRMMKED
ncbi:MAG: carbamoyl phosphate synthase small subunit, partial [Lachnospiraceae bacterium]|nr:carbamoyl phosphate synthase small subunit [Lachnospiraceae bacterium]